MEWGEAVPQLSHNGVCCYWREDAGFVVWFVVELVIGFDVGKCVFFGYALGVKVGLPPPKNESDVGERAIEGRERSGSDCPGASDWRATDWGVSDR